MLLSLAATALASAAAAPAAIAPDPLTGLFIAACLDGSAVTGGATPMEFDALPIALRSRLGQPSAGKVWKLAVPGDAYLYSLKYTERGWGPNACGVASKNLALQSASAAVESRLRGVSMPGSYASKEWVDEKAGYRALATRTGGFTILQINMQNQSQTEAQAPR